MKIVISGSVKRFEKEMEDFAKNLESSGHLVVYPTMSIENSNLTEEEKKEGLKKLLDDYFKSISECDVMFIYNKDGYIGYGVTVEMSYGFALNKPIYALEVDPEIVRGFLIKDYANSAEGLLKLL